MSSIVTRDGAQPDRLDRGWRMALSPPDAWSVPSAVPADADWIAARVPGTAAAALREAGRWDESAPLPLDDHDVWFDTTIAGTGAQRLHFAGLATLATVFLDDAPILRSDNMFHAHDVDVVLAGRHRLSICFRALRTKLAAKGRRSRWRTRVAAPATLRFVRTTLLGHMPGWCPPVTPVGPWRPVGQYPSPPRVRALGLRTSLDDDTGVLDVAVEIGDPAAATPHATCAGTRVPLEQQPDGRWRGTLRLPAVARWWPHTHGDPALHDVTLSLADETIALGRVGFRTLELHRGADGRGFALRVNGRAVFCRGACWTSADLVGLDGKDATYRPLLVRMRAAGMNMVRVGATGVYEDDAFYRLCDELGLLVWQDFMFSSFDYPVEDPAFVASATLEARQFLDRTQTSPALAMLCGASEIGMQAAMFGLPRSHWSNALVDVHLAGIAQTLRPDVPYVEQTPFGGALPFVADTGTSHYYGVSAFKRPLDDARRADVRFAAECLCFANVPDEVPVRLVAERPATEHPAYLSREPGDMNASWFFEDVRNHYLALLYGVDPAAMRQADPERFLDLSRAVSAEVMEAVFADWRRVGSPTGGGLVWFLRDLWPGAGWGVLDSTNRPKPAYYGLVRACRPQTIVLTDEGLNGLRAHVLNEAPARLTGTLSITCLREGRTPVMTARRDVDVAARDTLVLDAADLWGGFFDTTYAHRFGPPAHDVTVARLSDAAGRMIADAFHFPLGRGAALHEPGLSATLSAEDGAWILDLAAACLAQSVHVRDAAYEPDEHWFHLAPGHPRRVRLRPRHTTTAAPSGLVAGVSGRPVGY